MVAGRSGALSWARYQERGSSDFPLKTSLKYDPLSFSHAAAFRGLSAGHLFGRSYRPEWEEELLSLEKVCSYLAQGRWFRSVRSNGFFGLGGYQYYLGKHFAQRGVAIRFDPEGIALICQPEGSEQTIRLPAQGLTKAELMGELAALQALLIYQLALPFSLEAWRQLEYAHNLTAG